MTQLTQKWAERFEDGIENGTPEEWIKFGFTPDDYVAWYDAGGFEAEKCNILSEAGIWQDEVSRLPTQDELDNIDCPFFYGSSIAYMFSNGDLSLEDVKKLIE